MAHLSSDAVAEILGRLPVKSVLRFRSVCKTWFNIIGDSHFVSMHLTRAVGAAKLCLLFVPHDYHALYFVEPESPSFKATKLNVPAGSMNDSRWGSCTADGLLCITSKDSDNHIYTQICNPATGTSVELPVVSVPVELREEDALLIVSALSFNASTQHYHVVHTLEGYIRGHNLVFSFRRNESQVFVPASNSWRLFSTASNVNFCDDTVAAVNNSFHWLLKDADYILSFDLACETYGSIALPQGGSDLTEKLNEDALRIINLDGCLSIVEAYDSHPHYVFTAEIRVWIMKDYNVEQSWEKLLLDARPWPISPISFWRNNELLVHCHSSTLALYNIDNGEHTSLWIEGFPYETGHKNYVYEVHPYIGNLLQLRL